MTIEYKTFNDSKSMDLNLRDMKLCLEDKALMQINKKQLNTPK